MESNNNVAGTDPINNTEPAAEPGTAPAEEKKFTQAELDGIIGERIAKVKKQYEDKYSDYDKFKEWQEKQKTEAEKQAERDKEFEAAKTEIARLKAEKKVIAANAQKEFAEYVVDKLLKLDGDFDKNLEDFKKSNPQFFSELTVKKIATAPPLNGKAAEATTSDKMNNLIRNYKN